jgi:hypothetical protein
MEEITRCKRCKAILTNLESIKRGYGKTCYRITQLQKLDDNNQNDYNTEISFLKCEINMLKRMVTQIRTMGVKNLKGIERIKRIDVRPEQDINKGSLSLVVKELKVFFKESKLLKVGTFTDKELGISSLEIQVNNDLVVKSDINIPIEN